METPTFPKSVNDLSASDASFWSSGDESSSGMSYGSPPEMSSDSDDHSVEDIAPFLSACANCNRILDPGFASFMYRGLAFCDEFCRDEFVIKDMEKKKKTRKTNGCSPEMTGRRKAADPPKTQMKAKEMFAVQ
ncbi:hypothetical protein KSP39_PZI017024 [Platanthera zijinensis]|uniref:FLZ-type domain-containing protein n=1 Tax=Platanthera zijinensis TaxID=2320716 RepID=A0AAP0B807_9ASPA